jgi:hypothetical protein
VDRGATDLNCAREVEERDGGSARESRQDCGLSKTGLKGKEEIVRKLNEGDERKCFSHRCP